LNSFPYLSTWKIWWYFHTY